MSLTIGIVGLPNVGKSTLFNALTKNDVLAANYPFATIEPNVGVVGVPDPRLGGARRASSAPPRSAARRRCRSSTSPASSAAPRRGQGLGNKFLANIRESDAICQVIRAFTDPDVVHVDGEVVPADDIETINTELILADLQTLEKALPRLEKEARMDKDAARPCRGRRRRRRSCSTTGTHASLRPRGIDPAPLRELHLLTAKPFLYVFNVDEDELGDEELSRRAARRWSRRPRRSSSTPRSRPSWPSCPTTRRSSCCSRSARRSPGSTSSPASGSRTLGLQTYLTAGPKESRAWTIPVGATAPEAAGVIHTDFQRGFIKAEVVSFDDLVDAGSMAEAKARGQGAHRGQGLRHGRRRRRGVPLQRLTHGHRPRVRELPPAMHLWKLTPRPVREAGSRAGEAFCASLARSGRSTNRKLASARTTNIATQATSPTSVCPSRLRTAIRASTFHR